MLETECKYVFYQEPENVLIYDSEKSLQLLILLDNLLLLLRLKFVANKIFKDLFVSSETFIFFYIGSTLEAKPNKHHK
jgi:hypothetical protein